MRALRLSLRFGHGDVHWFENLDHDDQALVVAFERCESEDLAKARARAATSRKR